MGICCRLLLLLTAATSLAIATAYAQDAPSLGDLARQQRQQKEQSKTASGKDAKPSKVITNEEIPGHAAGASAVVASSGEATPLPASADGAKQPADQWKSQILAQKNQIATLQSQSGRTQRVDPFCSGKLRRKLRGVERASEREARAGRADASSIGRSEKASGRNAGICSQTRLWQLGLRSVV